MAKEYLSVDQLPLDLRTVSARSENAWMTPVSDQKPFINDYIRRGLEFAYERDTGIRDIRSQNIEEQCDQALREDQFTQEEIRRVKHFYTQNLCIFISDIIAENLMKLGLFLAGNNLQGEQETSRILIRKRMIDGHMNIVAEAEYSNLRCYGLTANGELDEQALKRIPGTVKAIYTLEHEGFKLSHVEASNSHLLQLVNGNFPEDTSIDELAINAAEEEFKNSIGELEQARRNSSSSPLISSMQPEMKTIEKELKRQSRSIHKDDDSYVESMGKLSMVAGRVVDAVSMPAHIPTIKRLTEITTDKFVEPDPAKPSKLKWALIGVAAVLVLGVCVVASVASFGALALPGALVGIAAAGVALQATCIVLGTAAATTTAIATKKVSEPVEPITPSPLKSSLQSIVQKFGLFASETRKKDKEKEVLSTKEAASDSNLHF